MTEQLSEQVKSIKRSFRLYMNGVTAASMRQKGVNYHLNWGVSVMDLKRMADEIGYNYSLSIELWKENIRECKILAAMVMPPERMLPEVVDVWMEQIPTLEIAESLSFHLLQYLDGAPEMAFRWIASDRYYHRICGYHILARLFSRKEEPDERGINEYLDQVAVALSDEQIAIRKAAANSLHWFEELGEIYQKMARHAIKH